MEHLGAVACGFPSRGGEPHSIGTVVCCYGGALEIGAVACSPMPRAGAVSIVDRGCGLFHDASLSRARFGGPNLLVSAETSGIGLGAGVGVPGRSSFSNPILTGTPGLSHFFFRVVLRPWKFRVDSVLYFRFLYRQFCEQRTR